ncbi:MAG: murein biosynthesis integral membrane protein MurJ [Leptolyngbyaceae bacterium]|nr:murein biosynthesis integral membrane protein MurJ [Leptolyngbyaceae bacterium]
MRTSEFRVSNSPKSSRSLVSIASIVAIATLISKVFGLVRQQSIAAAFGVGPAVDAFSYAYVIPGFLLILLGGINGPFHSAMVSVLSKRDRKDAAILVETITTIIGGALLLVSILIFVGADPLIHLIGPGLEPETRAIAVQQLRIMSPMAMLAGLIGIGFGTLNSADHYWLPSISPLLSSSTVLIGLGILVLVLGENITDPRYAMLGGIVLAASTLGGALVQWLVQIPVQWKAGLGQLRLRFNLHEPGVMDVLKVMGPATFASGMMQINVYTDLFFASGIPQAAAALNYANLLVQTPLGIISSVLLVPLLPVFSRLADPNDWTELKERIRQGLFLTGLTMLPLGALMVALAFPIVRVIYERFAFDEEASILVASVLMAYGIGMFVYLGRDVLVRVFYGLGDADTPFKISVANIFLNALLDVILIQYFGVPGLVLATVGVNLISMLALLWFLDRKLRGLPWNAWLKPVVLMIGGSVLAGVAAWGTRLGVESLWGTEGFFIQLANIIIAGSVGLAVFGAIASQLQLPEVALLTGYIKQRFMRR